MRPWLTRAAVLAVLHAAADTLIAYYRLGEPTELTVPRGVALGLLVGAALLWGALDGLHRKLDRGRTWVLAAVYGGLLAAVLGLIAKAVLLNQTSGDDIWPAITGGAAFTALLILIPAGIGLAVGGAMKSPKEPVDLDEDEEEEKPSPRPRRHRTAKATSATRSDSDSSSDSTDDDEPEGKPSPRPRRQRKAGLASAARSGSASDTSDDADPDEKPSPRPSRHRKAKLTPPA